MNKLRTLFGLDFEIEEIAHLVDSDYLHDEEGWPKFRRQLAALNSEEYLLYLHAITVTKVVDTHFKAKGGLAKRVKSLELTLSINEEQRQPFFENGARVPRMKFLNQLADEPRLGPDVKLIGADRTSFAQFDIQASIPAWFFQHQGAFRIFAFTYVSQRVPDKKRKLAARLTPVPTAQYAAKLKRDFGEPTVKQTTMLTPVTLEKLPARSVSTSPQVVFSWIHVSDLHFGAGSQRHRLEQEIVVQRILDDLSRRTTAGSVQRPDAVFVTGDVAFSGKRAQYERAQAWLDSLLALWAQNRQAVFVVPGNHDVDHAVDEKDSAVRRLVDAIREGEDIVTVLEDPNDRERLRRRQGEFWRFAERYGPPEIQSAAASEGRLFWQCQVSPKGMPLAIVGLNTALVSRRQDKGKLTMGLAQAKLAAEAARIGTGILLTHHPLNQGWLSDEAKQWAHASRGIKVHLCGHVHDPSGTFSRSSFGRSNVTLVSAASHGDENEPPAYGYSNAQLELHGDQTSIRVWPRKWSSKLGDFVCDSELAPSNECFVLEIA